MLHSANTKVRGRFSEKRRGLSHRCARNASAALENFVRHPKRLFQQYRSKADLARGASDLSSHLTSEHGAAFQLPVSKASLNDQYHFSRAGRSLDRPAFLLQTVGGHGWI
jgi:hypothetical protein